MTILEIVSNALMILAYFFNPELRKKRDEEKIWSIFNNLEEKLAQAFINKDMYLADKIRYWMKEMRDKYSYLEEKK
jgi:hypothetical protein